MRRLLIVCLVLASASALAETYRWVDKAGHVVISDTAPPGRARDVKVTGSAPPTEEQPFAIKQAAEKYPVTLYTSSECAIECRQARDLLNSRGVPFTEKMLQKPEDIEELKKLVGDIFVPSLKVGSQSFRGFESGAYNNLLDLAGYPKTALPGSKPTGGLAQ